jgi:hypothetical protein
MSMRGIAAAASVAEEPSRPDTSGSTPLPRVVNDRNGGDATCNPMHIQGNAAPTVRPAGAAKKYERVGQMMIRPLLVNGGHSAFDLARMFYAQYSDLDFEDDLVDYMRHGYVVTRPKLFAMVRPILHEGERIWFIRIIVGNLAEAIGCMPCWLPKVAYCRNNQGNKMVVVDTDRAIKLSIATGQNGNGNDG